MSMCNSKFIHVNMLRAAELRFGPDVMFSDGLRKTIEACCSVLHMNATASSIALLNIVATTLEFSSVSRSAGDRVHVPLNLYSMVLAPSCMYDSWYTRTDHTRVVFVSCSIWQERHIQLNSKHRLSAIRCAHGGDGITDLCLDEFSRAGLLSALDRCTKIFMTDEADMTFADAGLFNGFAKPSAEMNCRCKCS